MKKKSIILAVVLLMAFSSIVSANGRYVTGKYWQGPLQFYKNQSPVNIGVNPIIINGTTYVPIRAVSQVLGMGVQWNAQNRSITITDASMSETYYLNLISSQQKELNDANSKFKTEKEALEKKIKDLEKERDDYKKKYDDLAKNNRYYDGDDLESVLNSREGSARIDGTYVSVYYDVYERSNGYYDVDITLKGNNSSPLSTSAIETFLEDDVMPYFRDGNYRYNRYGDYRGYRNYEYYYSSTIVRDFKDRYGRYPDAAEYRREYEKEYPNSNIPSDYDYRYHENGRYNDRYYDDFKSVYFSVKDSGGNKTTTYTGYSDGSVR